MCVFASTRNDNGSCQLIYSAICEIEGACAHERQKKTAERCQRDKRKKYELDTQQKYCPIMKHLSGPNDNACVIKWDYIRIRNASLCNVNDIRLTKHSSTRNFWLASEKLWQNGKNVNGKPLKCARALKGHSHITDLQSNTASRPTRQARML